MIKFRPHDLLLLKARCKSWPAAFSGVDYSRTTEWPLAANLLDLQDGQEVLDVGSGDNSLFPLLLAWKARLRLVALDYSDEMPQLKRWATKGKEQGWLRGMIEFTTGDIRALEYSDAHFDRVACVSTIEHIPDEGDTTGIRELARVLRASGKLVLTCPFVRVGRDEFKRDSVYERSAQDELLFFQRLYDFETLDRRLIEPSGLACETKLFLRERGRKYFWEQDCLRTQREGKTVLSPKGLSYIDRCLAFPYSQLYTETVNEAEARREPDGLFAAVVVLRKT